MNQMRLQKKSLSKVSLLDQLRRRKTTLEKFLAESGIVTYELLLSRCKSIGVVPPTEEQFSKARGNSPTPTVSSPTEGIVVLEPPVSARLVSESGGKVTSELSLLDYDTSVDDDSKTVKKKGSKKSQ